MPASISSRQVSQLSVSSVAVATIYSGISYSGVLSDVFLPIVVVIVAPRGPISHDNIYTFPPSITHIYFLSNAFCVTHADDRGYAAAVCVIRAGADGPARSPRCAPVRPWAIVGRGVGYMGEE